MVLRHRINSSSSHWLPLQRQNAFSVLIFELLFSLAQFHFSVLELKGLIIVPKLSNLYFDVTNFVFMVLVIAEVYESADHEEDEKDYSQSEDQNDTFTLIVVVPICLSYSSFCIVLLPPLLLLHLFLDA